MDRLENLLKEILSMEMGECDSFKLTTDRFLFVENWKDGNKDFTLIELNSGEETEEGNCLDEVIIGNSCAFRNEKEIRDEIEYILSLLN